MDGKIQPFETQRTKRKALNRLSEIVKNECDNCSASSLSILETDAIDSANEMKADFMAHYGYGDIEIFDLPPAIIVHAGPGVIAASFFVS